MTDILLMSLYSEHCPACGGKKKSGNSFCYPCYRRLPPKMQRDLYKQFDDGYAEAHEAAYLKLKEMQGRRVDGIGSSAQKI
jgi:hypothetical protein